MQDAERAGRRIVRHVLLSVTLLVLQILHPALGSDARCTDILEMSGRVVERHWLQQGETTVRFPLPRIDGRDLLVRIAERGVDVEVEFQDQNGAEVARTDSPIERDASQHGYWVAGSPFPTSLIVKAKEPARVKGAVALYLTSLPRQGVTNTPSKPSVRESSRIGRVQIPNTRPAGRSH